MSKIHLLFGIAAFVVFLVTGQFMEGSFPDKESISQEFRILMRSRHIYILLSSFIHIALGLYFQAQNKGWRKYLQIAGSAFLIAGSVLLVWAFFYETYTTRAFSDASRFGLYTTFAGILFHLFSHFRLKSRKNE